MSFVFLSRIDKLTDYLNLIKTYCYVQFSELFHRQEVSDEFIGIVFDYLFIGSSCGKFHDPF